MNKIGMVFGIAAVATLAGCKDPDYNRTKAIGGQNEVKTLDTTTSTTTTTTTATPALNDRSEAKAKCTCPPGTKHTSPCKCGLADCTCVVDTKPVVNANLSKPVEPEYTIYVVQNGDYLAKISKKYNITINSIKRLNPSIKNDVICVGQKLKLPGKVDVGVQEPPTKATSASAATAAATPKKPVAAYTGPTKDYVVKNGDTLGAIAYGNGITIRQLKALNGLSSDSLKIGQKLKIPAEKVVKDVKKSGAKSVADAKKPVEKVEEKTVTEVAVEKPIEEAATVVDATSASSETATPPVVDASSPTVVPVVEKTEEAPSTTTYVVQEGDDIVGVATQWGVNPAEIRELNNLGEGDRLTPGQILKLPAGAKR